MTRPWKHPKTGVYQFRRAVPEDLRALVGRREEKRSLRTKDPAEARQRHALVLAEVEERWAALRAGPKSLSEPEAHQLAAVCYDSWLEAHRSRASEQTAWHTGLFERMWVEAAPVDFAVGLDVLTRFDPDETVVRRQEGWCRAAADDLLAAKGLVVDDASRLRVAKAIGAAIQRASLVLARLAQGEPDEGQAALAPRAHVAADMGSSATVTVVSRAAGLAKGAARVSLKGLVEDWWREARASGRKPSTYESYRHAFQGLSAYLKHDDAGRVSPEDVVAYKDHRLTTPNAKTGRAASAKTVKDSDLAAFKTVFGWAVANRKLEINPAVGITLKVGKAPRLRPKGFTDEEAQALLAHALAYRPGEQEQANTAAAKRWVPWLMAFTGARVGELAQLRRQDVTRRGEHWVVRITPEAGTVKTNQAREVVLHRQLVEQGFPAFVQGSSGGHLFLTPADDGDVLGPLQGVKNRLAEFAREVVADPRVAPNHGWRHRFKTVGREAGVDHRTLDAIQGHAPRSDGEDYGDVTLPVIAAGIARLPRYDLA